MTNYNTDNMESKFNKGKWNISDKFFWTIFLFYKQIYLICVFCLVPERPDFPQEEEKVLAYWKEIDAFHEQMRRT